MPQDTAQERIGRDPFHAIRTREAKIRECAQLVAQAAQSGLPAIEQRSQQRVPYARLIALTPLRDGDLDPCGGPIHVVGKYLAPLGLDFFHHEPIPQRYAIASLDAGSNHWMHFLLKITWCRFLKSKWYDSGGRFIKMVEWSSEGQYIDTERQPPDATDHACFFAYPQRNELRLECMD